MEENKNEKKKQIKLGCLQNEYQKSSTGQAGLFTLQFGTKSIDTLQYSTHLINLVGSTRLLGLAQTGYHKDYRPTQARGCSKKPVCNIERKHPSKFHCCKF